MVGFLVTFCLLTVLTTVVSLPNNKNETDTKLKLLEETVSDLKKHILAEEQKQTAVLSSVLSRLTETTEELAQVQHNYTVLENQLTSLKTNYTPVDGAGTDENLRKHLLAQEQKQTAVLSSVLSRLTETEEELDQLQYNYTVLEDKLSSITTNYTYGDGAIQSLTGQVVAFQAHMAHNLSIQFHANSTLIFSETQYNEGGCWNSSTGVFTAPVNGTYMFWIDLAFHNLDAHFYTVTMNRNGEHFDKLVRHVDGHEAIFISRTSLTQLIEGDRVEFVADRTVKYWPLDTSCGGVLLH